MMQRRVIDYTKDIRALVDMLPPDVTPTTVVMARYVYDSLKRNSREPPKHITTKRGDLRIEVERVKGDADPYVFGLEYGVRFEHA